MKAVNGDAAFKARHAIGAVNSINWGRVAAQIVYYFAGYFAATRDDAQRVDFAVPSGNFGNILAGHVARELGLPVGRLILATNENDVLDEFFRTGRYRPRASAETHATSSPSMDISKASNFERFVYDVVGRDAAAVRALWAQLQRDGGFDLSGTPHWPRVAAAGFVSGRSTHAGPPRHDPRRARALRHRHRSAHGGRRQGRAASCAIRRCRSSASRPRCRRSSRPPSARRSAASPRGRPRTPTSKRGRSGSASSPPTPRG